MSSVWRSKTLLHLHVWSGSRRRTEFGSAAMGAHRALSEKWAILDFFPPMAPATAGTPVFPCAGLLRFLLSPNTQVIT